MHCLLCAGEGKKVPLVEVYICTECSGYIEKENASEIFPELEENENIYQKLLKRIQKEIEEPGEIKLTLEEVSRIDLGDYVKLIINATKTDSKTRKLKVAKMIFSLILAESELGPALLIEIANYALALSIRECKKR